MYKEPRGTQSKASYLRPEGQVNWGEWQSHNWFKNSHLFGYESVASFLDQSQGKYHRKPMRIQSCNMQTVSSAGKYGQPSHSWFEYRANCQDEKHLFLLILLCCPTWTQTYFLRTSRIFRLTPDWAHVLTGFGQSLPRTLMFSCFARYSSTSGNKKEKHSLFFS